MSGKKYMSMKKIDVTHSVMDRVSRFEARRSARWLAVFWVTVLVLTGSIIAFFFRAFAILSERQTWDVLEIFYQDREIISEFWQDTAAVAIAELPQKTLLLAVSALVLLAASWIITRHRRRIVKRRLAELAKWKKRSNNT